MRKSFVASLLLVGAAATLATAAFAQGEFSSDTHGKLMNARMAQERASLASRLVTSGPGDTTWVGYSPTFAGSNYWSVGTGANRGYSTNPGDYGYWNWDNPVHGDSLQGWWPYRQLWNQAAGAGANVPDDVRPWWAIDHGNQVNYVINQGAGLKRTFGITGVWHSDPGGTGAVMTPTIGGTNPVEPNWAPLGGSRSAWCGLRAHGDQTEVDPITGNAYNVNALEYIQPNGVGAGNGTGTSRKFPGYASQWDQMLYRDIDLTGAGATVTITFKVRTRMSDQTGTAVATRTGWFDKDPKAVVAGNFIKSSGNPTPPADSFMVYVGNPVEPDGDNTNSNDFVASDGLSYDVYDAQRRWFSEVIRTEGGSAANTHYELFTTYGNRDSSVSVSIPTSALTAYGSKARLVFRIKTNRGFDDENGSSAGAYTSGGAGAAQVDDVTVNTGSGPVVFGNFENASDIDNSTGTLASAAWKSTGKPPGVFWHVRKLSELVYQDLCGAPGSIYRICNMDGNVISMGDFDLSEQNSGVFGTPEQERFDGMMSPTINLMVGAGNNNMGLNASTADPSEDYYIFYEIYTGVFDIFTQGCGWQFNFQSYPATQSDGVRTWGELRQPGFQYFNPDKQCFQNLDAGRANGIIRTSNAGLYPDSLRIGFRKLVQCYRFSISANCAPALGAYIDNVSLVCINGGAAAPISVDIWQLFNDTFPANESSTLPGTAAFDTCAALVKSGLNIAQGTGTTSRYTIPGDSIQFNVAGENVRADLVFRINPGPGNYVVAGSPASGLRVVPTSPTAITPGDGSFWTSYILDNGSKGSVGGHPAGTHATRWNSLVWNSARCDTMEANTFPVAQRNLNSNITGGFFMTNYHEADLAGPRASLAVARNWCFLNDVTVTAPINAIHCNTAKDVTRFGVYPPAWVAATVATNGWDGNLLTTENTKILPDGLFTPGTHVQYFLRREDINTSAADYAPDSNFVSPQTSEGSFDGHRWQQFSVLPDAWKKSAYGGLGQACMLYVDWNDRRGDERQWVSIADSIGATLASKHGAHNGWHQTGGVSVNDPSGFVRNLNQQPGTTWDMYGIKASESLNTGAGSLGARLSFRGTSATNLIDGQWAMNAPTLNMLEAYYRILLILTGDLNSSIFGPFADKSADDIGLIQSYLLGATAGNNRGVFMMGNGLVESFAPDPWLDLFGVDLAAPGYLVLSGNLNACADLTPQAPIVTTGDIYGVVNGCTFTNDVYVTTGPDATASLLYPYFGSVDPYIASVYKDAIAPNYWKSVVAGFDILALRSRFCDSDLGRLAYFYNAYSNIFGSICQVQGQPTVTLDTPNNDNGQRFVDFMTVRGNPLVKGSAVIAFGLPVQDRVSLKVFDVSGRLVRTLSDGQLYKAGEHKLMWDGVDNHGRQVARGVYFASYTTERGVSKSSKITVVLQ